MAVFAGRTGEVCVTAMEVRCATAVLAHAPETKIAIVTATIRISINHPVRHRPILSFAAFTASVAGAAVPHPTTPACEMWGLTCISRHHTAPGKPVGPGGSDD
jgi:hypothetical protein